MFMCSFLDGQKYLLVHNTYPRLKDPTRWLLHILIRDFDVTCRLFDPSFRYLPVLS